MGEDFVSSCMRDAAPNSKRCTELVSHGRKARWHNTGLDLEGDECQMTISIPLLPNSCHACAVHDAQEGNDEPSGCQIYVRSLHGQSIDEWDLLVIILGRDVRTIRIGMLILRHD